jgi:hypothetical protein
MISFVKLLVILGAALTANRAMRLHRRPWMDEFVDRYRVHPE